MAKRKLSPRQIQSLRSRIRAMLKKGAEKAAILKTVAARYTISPESVRWHLKKLGGPAGRASSRPGGSTSRRAKKSAGLPLRAARTVANGVLGAVATVSGAVLKKAQEARKLLPKLEKKLLESDKLAHAQARVTQALQAAQAQAARLKRKIASLISG